ncbi:MAG: DinB family protein [Verrucomicrobia bacterium]|nr:DinB family protein [Cytophagales bacterium]
MRQTEELLEIIHQYFLAFEQISEEKWTDKPSPERWSKREILGHLIDSAMNNLRRLVVSQYEQNNKIFYFQNEWVQLQDYQNAPTEEVKILWKLLNLQMARVWNSLPEEKLQNTCDTGKNSMEQRTLAFLIDDYLIHLKHHLKQID